uniref:Uncharacterized protein n=1 Tax=Caenorhabditis tropicalis TaxID=1561998 RepID=A0A1I7TVP5_9PELO
MSRDVSSSPKSADIRFGSIATANEPIRVEVVDEEQNSPTNQLGFSATLSTSFVSDDLSESIDDLTITKEKKKLRPSKVAEDITRKRHEANALVYEWDPNELTETLVREPAQLDPNNAIFEEKGMLKLLEDFRNGELRWLDEPQISAMRKVKEAHEEVSDIHLKVYEIESVKRNKRKHRRGDKEKFDFSDSDDSEGERMIEKLFEKMNSHMIDMHSALDTVPFYDASQNRNDNEEEYFSS